eukprot:UN25540
MADIKSLFHENDLYPGMQVRVKGHKDVGLVFKIIDQGKNKGIIAVELEGPSGTSNGEYDGTKYFECPDKCAVFVPRSEITEILPVDKRALVFDMRLPGLLPLHIGDVVMINKVIGVGVVRYASTYLIGCELNVPLGDSNGNYQGKKLFKTK